MELAAAIAPDSDQSELVRALTCMHRPGAHQKPIDQARAITDQLFDGLITPEAFAQFSITAFQRSPERRDRVAAGIE